MSKQLASAIANFIISNCVENTTTGNWITSFDEISEKFGVPPRCVERMKEDILDELYERDVCLDIDCYDDVFDIILGLAYCGLDEEEED